MARRLLALALLLLPSPALAQSRADDEATLRRMHDAVLAAHRAGKVDDWMKLETPSVVSVNNGAITFPDEEQRRAQRGVYLGSTTFETYRDLRRPIVRLSDDGSLGWLICEVEVAGTTHGEDGEAVDFEAIWAWIELYEKTDAGWRIVGNASNRR